ncbi:MAG: hypothetical protein E3K37_14015 [Candidatus Kuenenia sp.]|nr:hypothetical protein [Candidatus Kuenenia hertensis]
MGPGCTREQERVEAALGGLKKQVRYCVKGIGLDRIPEVRTLRGKVEYITSHGKPEEWSKELSRYWPVITTDFVSNVEEVASRMFSRWSQENFLKYMMEHSGIDRLIEYEQEEINETTKVVNPRYRELQSQIRTKTTTVE